MTALALVGLIVSLMAILWLVGMVLATFVVAIEDAGYVWLLLVELLFLWGASELAIKCLNTLGWLS